LLVRSQAVLAPKELIVMPMKKKSKSKSAKRSPKKKGAKKTTRSKSRKW
jgi:hypothetical protein